MKIPSFGTLRRCKSTSSLALLKKTDWIMAISSLTQRYEEERQKRQTLSKGLAQYLSRYESPAFTLEDPWIEHGTAIKEPVGDGGRAKIIVFGAGFAGLLAAVKCLDSGAASDPNDILIVDPAGGFGGTWYWNRYVSQS